MIRRSLPVASLLALFCVVGCAVRPGLTGNDTGGIISWSPQNEATAFAAAADHCARYNKGARITSIHPWYGDYIAFVCRWNRYPNTISTLN